ncbi:MAG: hypothetical protein R2788_09810 [Saprospiraceae bacterium]
MNRTIHLALRHETAQPNGVLRGGVVPMHRDDAACPSLENTPKQVREHAVEALPKERLFLLRILST